VNPGSLSVEISTLAEFALSECSCFVTVTVYNFQVKKVTLTSPLENPAAISLLLGLTRRHMTSQRPSLINTYTRIDTKRRVFTLQVVHNFTVQCTRNYTMSQKQHTAIFYGQNFGKRPPIFEIISLLDLAINL